MDEVIMRRNDMRLRLVRDDFPAEPYHDGQSPILRLYPLGGVGWRADYIDSIGGYPPAAIDDIAAAGSRWGRDRELFERYLRMFHGTTAVQWYDGRCGGGDYVYVTFDTADWRQHHGIADGQIDVIDMSEWQAYCEGDVYGYIIEEHAAWQGTDSAGAVIDTMQTWETVDSCWGFYGFDHAEQAARQAVHDLTTGNNAQLLAKRSLLIGANYIMMEV